MTANRVIYAIGLFAVVASLASSPFVIGTLYGSNASLVFVVGLGAVFLAALCYAAAIEQFPSKSKRKS